MMGAKITWSHDILGAIGTLVSENEYRDDACPTCAEKIQVSDLHHEWGYELTPNIIVP